MVPSIAEFYHLATRYDPEGLSASAHKLDWSRQPSQFKDWPGLPTIPLGPFMPSEAPERFDLALAGMLADPGKPRTLVALSYLLYFAYGITAVVEHPNQTVYLRAAPSAGGLYPAEVYVASQGKGALAEGLYHYQVRDHALVPLGRQDVWNNLVDATFQHPALKEADLALVLTGVFGRSEWRYRDRAYRRVLLDTGHLAGNLALEAPLVGFHAVPVAGFADDEVSEVLGLDPAAEGPLLLLALADRPEVPGFVALPSARNKLGTEIPEGHRLAALHEASKIPSGKAPKPARLTEPPSRPRLQLTVPESLEAPAWAWGDRLSDTLLRRRSCRAFQPGAIDRQQLAAVLAFGYQDGATLDRPLLDTWVVVHDVKGLDPGCYFFDPLTATLRQTRFRDLREETRFACLGQDLGGDASAVVFHTANLAAAVKRWGDRGYRYLHLDAGHIGQRLNLAAVRLGLGASGIAGFFDGHVNDLLGIGPEAAVIYLTTLGKAMRPDAG